MFAKKIDPKLLEKRRNQLKSFKTKMDIERTPIEKMADFLTAFFGNIWFLSINAIWFTIWIPINMGLIPGIPIFDPFPFGFLTTTVSLEAIFLAVIVLISQNREQSIADMREEIDLRIDTLSEEKITKLLEMVDKIYDKLEEERDEDEELSDLKQRETLEDIEIEVKEELYYKNW